MSRDVTRSQLARRGLLTIVALLVIGTFISLRSNGTFGEAPHVSADVATAGGALRKGSDVKMNGVIVGKVSSITRAEDGGVQVDMEMSEDDLGYIPDNVVARILPATVFGTTYVDLVVHGAASEDFLGAGDKIEADSTQDTLEFQQALDDIDRLVKALGPAELASAIGSAAQALDGRGEQISSTVDLLNSYLDRINPRMPAIRSDLDALATNVGIIDEIAPDLLDATDDGLEFLATIVRKEAALNALIAGGTSLAETARGFLADNQQHLVDFINGSAVLVDALYDNRRAGITDAMTLNIALGREIPSALREGFLETDLYMRLDFPGYYGSGDRPSYRTDSTLGMTAYEEPVR